MENYIVSIVTLIVSLILCSLLYKMRLRNLKVQTVLLLLFFSILHILTYNWLFNEYAIVKEYTEIAASYLDTIVLYVKQFI